MTDIYRFDFRHDSKYGHSEATVSSYWTNVAKNEIKRLRVAIQAGDEEAEQKLARLEDAIAPITEIELLLINFRPGEDRELLLDELVKKYGDPEIAKEVFLLIGPERSLEIATTRAIKAISSDKSSRRSIDSESSISGVIGNESFLDFLNLSEIQEENLKSVLSSFESKIETHHEETIAILDRESVNRWKKILSVLDPSQRKIAEERLGTPIRWFVVRNASFDSLNQTGGGGIIITDRLVDYIEKVGRPINMIDEEEFSNAGFVCGDAVTHQLIKNDFLHGELNLNAEQKSRFKQLRDKFASIHRLANRVDQLASGKAEYAKEFEEILDSTNRLSQVELQIRLGPKTRNVVGTTSPQMIEAMGLTSDQVERINAIGKEFDNTVDELTTKAKAIAQSSGDRLIEDARAILDERQLEKLEIMSKIMRRKQNQEGGPAR